MSDEPMDADLDDLLSEIDLNEDPSKPPSRGRRALSAANDTRIVIPSTTSGVVTRAIPSTNGASTAGGITSSASVTGVNGSSQLRRQKSRGRMTSTRGTATEAESSGGEFAFSIRAAPAGKGTRTRASPLAAPSDTSSSIPMATLAPSAVTPSRVSQTMANGVLAPTLAASHHDDGSEYERASRQPDGGQRQRDVAAALHPPSSSSNTISVRVVADHPPSPPLSPPDGHNNDRERLPMIAMGVLAPHGGGDLASPSAPLPDDPSLFLSHDQERAAARAARRQALKKKRRGASQGSMSLRRTGTDSSGQPVTGGTRRTVREKLIEVTRFSCYDLIGDWTDTRRRICMHVCTSCVFIASLTMIIFPFTVAETRFASPFLYAASTIIGVMSLFGAVVAMYGTVRHNLSMLCGWLTLGGIVWALTLIEGIVGMLENVPDLRDAVRRYWSGLTTQEKAQWGNDMAILLSRAQSNVHAVGICAITTTVVMFVALLVHHTLRGHWMEELAADAAERHARSQLEVRRHERSIAAIDAVHGGHIGMFDQQNDDAAAANGDDVAVELNEQDMRADEQL